MAVILSLSANFPAIATWRPLYLLLTVIIVFSQKVDTTLSKGILRIVASLVGGVYGEYKPSYHTVISPSWCMHAECRLAAPSS